MEVTNDINFNNSPKAGNESKITYSGKLFQNGSSYVNIVYGFGDSWNNTTTKPMQKLDNGFVTNIRMREFDTFNFCFSDENNNWDNNNNLNYTSPILPGDVKQDIQEQPPIEDNDITEDETNTIEFGTDYSESIDDIIDNILGNTTKQNIINSKEENSVDNFLESINDETLPEIEALFNDLFCESVKEDSNIPPIHTEISMEPELAEELKEVGNVIEKFTDNNTSNNIEIEKHFDELFSQDQIKNQESTENDFDNTELIKLFEELFESSNNPVNFDTTVEYAKEQQTETETYKSEPVKLNVSEFNLDGLVSDILEPVITSETSSLQNDETSLFEETNKASDYNYNNESSKEKSLIVIDSETYLVSPKRLGYFYRLKKKIRLAFAKLAKIKKDFVKQLGF